MSHFGTAFGIGTPAIYPTGQNPWGFSPSIGQSSFAQGFSPQQSYAFSPSSIGAGYGAGSYGAGLAAPQQIAQLLQIVPQQLQQVQVLQQQQVVLLQQLLQFLPVQLHQLQQLIQFVPSQLQQLQQHQPFGAALSSPVSFGLAPHAFGGQATSQVM